MDESGFLHCYGNFFKNSILKVTWSRLYTFSKIARYIDNSILKDTLKLKILRTLIKIGTNSFIKTWVNIKWKSTRLPWKLSLAEKYDPALERTLHQSRWYFAYCYMLLIFSNKPSLYLTQCLLTYWMAFLTVYLHSYLLIVDILWSLTFIQYLFAFFIKTSKILMRFNVLFLRFSVSKCSYVLFPMKHSVLLTSKITRNISL